MATATQMARAVVLLAFPAMTVASALPTTMAMAAELTAWPRTRAMVAACVPIEQGRASALIASLDCTASNVDRVSMAHPVRCTVMRTKHAVATEPARRMVSATAAIRGG
eukprot:COSAG02_NODE_6498_length_3537_cov_2.666085_3_plen_109_part_00